MKKVIDLIFKPYHPDLIGVIESQLFCLAHYVETQCWQYEAAGDSFAPAGPEELVSVDENIAAAKSGSKYWVRICAKAWDCCSMFFFIFQSICVWEE